MRLAALEGGNAGRDDGGWRVEIRLADLEGDDVAALRLERLRLCEDLECGLGPESRHSCCERSHGSPMSLGRELSLTASEPLGPDDGGMACARRKNETVPRPHRDAIAVFENKIDRAVSAVQNFG